MNNLALVLLAAMLILSACSSGGEKMELDTSETSKRDYVVHPIEATSGYCFFVAGPKNILVDTGNPGDGNTILEQLERLSIKAEDIDLILLTHGHEDHIGSVAFLKEASNAEIIMGELDHFSIVKGINAPFGPELIDGYEDAPKIENFETAQADILVKSDLDLKKYGIDGRIITTPGHTPGSLSLILSKDALIGDLLLDEESFDKVLSYLPDTSVLKESIERVLSTEPEHVYISHGKVLSGKQAVSLLDKL